MHECQFCGNPIILATRELTGEAAWGELAWGDDRDYQCGLNPAGVHAPLGESQGELLDRMTRDPENYPHILDDDGSCVECGMQETEGWACISHPDWKVEP